MRRLSACLILASLACPVAFTAPASADPIVIDNGDVGYTRSGDGFYGNDPGWGYLNDFSWANVHNPANPAQATWQFSALTPGTYDVYATWPVREFWVDHAEEAPYTVFDGTPAGTDLGTVTVDQNLVPVGITYNGVTWYPLGSFAVTGTELAIRLDAIATMGGNLHADAVLIEAVPEPSALALMGLAGVLMWRRRSV